jgi:hypothetical protein
LSITVITETFNHAEGQSWSRVADAIDAAISAAEGFDDGTHDGPNRVLVIDASNDDRTQSLLASRQATTTVSLRHLRVPADTPYDVIKDLGALEATSGVVAYLDGDCSPFGDSSVWLRALFVELTSTGAPGVCGTTIYEGTSAVRRACSAMDFGFVLHRKDRVLGSYTSNNAMFRRDVRANEQADVDGLRCACYLHAQEFLRSGTPMLHARSVDALVHHEFPPLWEERFRRGYDAVAVSWTDPSLFEAKCFRRNRFIAATVGVARYMVSSVRLDARVIIDLQHYQPIPRIRVGGAIALVPLLRCIDAIGIWRALFFGPNPRWRHTVTCDQVTNSFLAE